MMAQRQNAAMDDPKQPTALLGGLSPGRFMRRHWQKAPLLVRQALPGSAPWVDRAALFALAARDDVESRLVRRLARQGGECWTLRRGPLPRRALPALAEPGWTLLVQGLDLHLEAAHRMLARFRFVPDARLDDLMLSYASDGGGVGPHTDSYDVFLIQVSGRRRWRWAAPARDERWRDDVPLKMLADFRPAHEALLEPGDLLYLPPRWGHDGCAVGADCMTASVGFRAPGAAELAGALLERLADAAPPARSAHYRDAAQGATASPGAIPAALQAFARRAVGAALARPHAIERALGEWLTEPKPQVWFEAERNAGPLMPGQGLRLDRRTRMGYDARCVYINGESLDAAGRDALLVHRLADARRLEAAEVARLSPAAREAIAQWLAAGWVHGSRGSDDRP
jgi:50S ribosomal protein L16 3-hydroxylase